MEELKNCPVCNGTEFRLFLEIEDYFLTHEKFNIQQCVNCSFKFVNPRPQEKELSKYYQSDEYISHDNTGKGLWNRLYGMARNLMLSRKYNLVTKHIKQGHILDIGCATGEFLNLFSKKGWTTIGIEPEQKARNFAREKYHLNVLPEEKINELPSLGFDVITLWHVLEHVSDVNRRMQDLKRLLSKNGILILALPNCNSFDAVKYEKFWAAYDVPRHLSHFTTETVEKLLVKHDFLLADKIPMKLDSFYVSLLSEKYKTGKRNWLSAIINGLASNLKADEKKGYSSMIFVAQHKNAL